MRKIMSIIYIFTQCAIFEQKCVKGLKFREVGNHPIVGNPRHFSGYELVNEHTEKVVYRCIKDWGPVHGGWNPNFGFKYKVDFFAKNVPIA
jgi:hypothetical protein